MKYIIFFLLEIINFFERGKDKWLNETTEGR